MSIQQMISSLKFNREQLGQRKKVFDVDLQDKGIYGKLEDTVQMKSHEFAAFQKRLFEQKKREKKRERVIIAITVLITLLIVISFLIFWNLYDFSVLEPSKF